MNVTIFSSTQTMVQPDKSFVIVPAGSDMAMVNFTTGYALGVTSITASASSLVTASTSVDVIGPNPFSLSVIAQPEQVAVGSSGRVVVWITGSIGHPARAPSNITITLTSSNLTVASLVHTTVTITSGAMSVSATYTTTNDKGVTTITASAQGLQSGFDTIQSFRLSNKPASLKAFFAPNPVIADSASYNSLMVAIVNSSGLPAVASTPTIVNLTSATTAIGTITSSVIIPPNTETATASFNSTFLVGTTVITASAQNLISAQVQASTYGSTPAAVELAPVSGDLLANGGTYSGVAVLLVDAGGNPAVAPADILVHVTSSNPSLVQVNSFVNIKTGQSSVVTAVQTGISSGVANISASTPGYGASFVLLTTVIPAPSGLTVYVGPSSTINSTTGSESLLTVQLHDVNDLPAQASSPTTVIVTSSNTSVIKAPLILKINPGI